MKKTIILILLVNFVFIQKSFSQIYIKDFFGPKKSIEKKQAILKYFKNTTTIFIARNDDEVDVLQEELNKVWKITPLKVVKYDELQNYLTEENYSFFEIKGLKVTIEKTESTSLYLSLYFSKINKKGKLASWRIAKLELSPNRKTLLRFYESKDNQFANQMYNEAVLYNWSNLTIVNFVQQVNDHILDKTGKDFLERKDSDKRLGELANKTLYVPKYVLKKFDIIAKKHSEADTVYQKEEKIFKNYDYKYEVTTLDELFQKYLDKEEKFYYLSTVKNVNRVLINVVDGFTGEIIYSDHPKIFTYNLKAKNLKELNSKIKKLNKK